MALREVLQFPDKRLRRVSKPIAEITDEIRALAADMLEVMYDEPGIGLAAPQVGEAVRLVVVDTEWREENAERSPLVLVNPEIVASEGEVTWTEGCLSVPEFEAEVERFARVRLRALALDGSPLEIAAEGLQAVCFQHEIDHLDGKLFVDYLSDLKRQRVRKKIEKERRLRAEGRAGETSRAPAI